nr:L,D-transpeptidase family protein [Mesorhizobium sp.]
MGTTFSHGCIRLTNWDAEDLGSMVQPGTKVEFKNETAHTVDEFAP